MTEQNQRRQVAAEAKKGDDSPAAARKLVEIGLFNDAVSRLYSAAFHYATGALLSVNVEARSHKSLQSLFSLHLVKAGKVDIRVARDLRRLQGLREAADYDRDFDFDEATALEELAVCETFIAALQPLLLL
jgi:uncharacterized protein (UPF0332 family)